ncbi:uncharacterized protein LOC129748204 [Uranotaenia lowii]|uniref:uncharacterized protein LOC129748204 n=1 Tax=Uranotaenia lowii TaxID=190385 RepID=UPI00247ADE3B|nr:uncharacterized protein LOC129748204 [Uranotaenia lowii]
MDKITINTDIPFCRLCSSSEHDLIPLFSGENQVELMQQYLDIQLNSPNDFPCYVCVICSEKLEELPLCCGGVDEDGNDYQDEDLARYKELCKTVDQMVRDQQLANQPAEPFSDAESFTCSHCMVTLETYEEFLKHALELRCSGASTGSNQVNVTVNQPEDSVDLTKADDDCLMVGDDYGCHQCSESFSEKKALYIHRSSVHDEKLCNICGMQFKSYSSLSNHYREHRFNV